MKEFKQFMDNYTSKKPEERVDNLDLGLPLRYLTINEPSQSLETYCIGLKKNRPLYKSSDKNFNIFILIIIL